jgi:hypothetical protein
MRLVAEQHDRPAERRLDARQGGGALGEFDGRDSPAVGSLLFDPGVLTCVDPMDAAAPPKLPAVADAQALPVVRRIRERDAGTDGVACPQQRPQIGLIGDPQRSGDQVIPAAVRTGTAIATDLARPALGGAGGRASSFTRIRGLRELWLAGPREADSGAKVARGRPRVAPSSRPFAGAPTATTDSQKTTPEIA